MSNSFEYSGYAITIKRDADAESPRECDNVGTMTCFHKRYRLGDKHDLRHDNFSSWSDVRAHLEKSEEAVVVMPIFMMDHSGLRCSVSSERFRQCDPQGWDWGCIGFIWTSRETVIREFGGKNITKKKLALAEKNLICEVETYDQYISGDVWYYNIEKDGEFIGSLGGLFGYEYAKSEAIAAADYHVTQLLPANA